LVKFQATNGGLIGRWSANEQTEISINGDRGALLDINPTMSETNVGQSLKTSGIFVKAGPLRVSAAFINQACGKFVSPMSLVSSSKSLDEKFTIK